MSTKQARDKVNRVFLVPLSKNRMKNDNLFAGTFTVLYTTVIMEAHTSEISERKGFSVSF